MSMQWSKEQLEKMKRPDLVGIVKLQQVVQDEFKRITGLEDIPLPTPVRLASSDRPIEITRFGKEAKESLIAEGAVVVELSGQSINTQRESQKTKGQPSFYYMTNESDRVVGQPSALSEVAIYPDPERFFIKGSDKDLTTQEELALKDTRELRKRVKSNNLSVVIPESAATLSELTFRYVDMTGKWLFGQDYAKQLGLDWVYGATKNPTNESGSHVAVVGDARPVGGLSVAYRARGRASDNVRVVRLVVPA